MPRRFIELAVRARRLVTRAPERVSSERERARPSARRQLGGELTQFSFRLALMVDLAYVGIGALGGAAIGRASAPAPQGADGASSLACRTESTRDSVPATPNAPNASSAPSTSKRLDSLVTPRMSR